MPSSADQAPVTGNPYGDGLAAAREGQPIDANPHPLGPDYSWWWWWRRGYQDRQTLDRMDRRAKERGVLFDEWGQHFQGQVLAYEEFARIVPDNPHAVSFGGTPLPGPASVTNEWKPIETAPKGSPILRINGPVLEVLWADHGAVGMAYYGQGASPEVGPRWNDRSGRACSPPTHWKEVVPDA